MRIPRGARGQTADQDVMMGAGRAQPEALTAEAGGAGQGRPEDDLDIARRHPLSEGAPVATAPPLGGSSNGRTTGSGPVNLGSNPSPPAKSRFSPDRPWSPPLGGRP